MARIERRFAGETAVVIGTGPSLTEGQLKHVEEARVDGRVRVFGVNNVLFDANHLDVHIADPKWYDYWWIKSWTLRNSVMDEKRIHHFTWDAKTASKYKLRYIPGIWADGLSKDGNQIHYGHASGYQIVNLATLYGCTRLLLLGYDMRYGGGYNKARQEPGEGRHYFGEYPPELQHWPSVGPENTFAGLLERFATIRPADYGVEIFNCTPGSAMNFFPHDKLENLI